MNLMASLGPLKADIESEDLGPSSKAINMRHQRHLTLVNGSAHQKLLNDSRLDKLPNSKKQVGMRNSLLVQQPQLMTKATL